MATNDRCIVLLCGKPTRSRTLLTKIIAGRLDLPVVSIDHLRESMPGAPEFGLVRGGTANPINSHSPADFLALELGISDLLWPSIEHYLRHTYEHSARGFVMVGANVSPSLIVQSFKNDRPFHSYFLSQPRSSWKEACQDHWLSQHTLSSAVRKRIWDTFQRHSDMVVEDARTAGIAVTRLDGHAAYVQVVAERILNAVAFEAFSSREPVSHAQPLACSVNLGGPLH
jgi:hypothetical protein